MELHAAMVAVRSADAGRLCRDVRGPFNAMAAAYRRLHGGTKAPELQVGVAARDPAAAVVPAVARQDRHGFVHFAERRARPPSA